MYPQKRAQKEDSRKFCHVKVLKKDHIRHLLIFNFTLTLIKLILYLKNAKISH